MAENEGDGDQRPADAGGAAKQTRDDRPTVARPVDPFTFPAVARLELDDLLEQLIDRANEVLRTQGRLRGLLRATQAVATGLDAPTLLQRIVDEARRLVGSRYAGLAVFDDDGRLTDFVHSGMDDETVRAIGSPPTGLGVLGAPLVDQRPLRLSRISDHPSSVGFPPGHPQMTSFLGVPVRIRGRVVGNLYVTDRLDGEEFSLEDQELVLALAAAAAAAIENAGLYDAVTRREHWLEASRTLTNRLLDVDDRDEALQLITRSLREAAGADFAAVAVPDAAGDLVVAAADGAGAAGLRHQRLPAESPTGQAVRDRAPVLVEDLRKAQDVSGPIGDLGVGPFAVVPLSARDQVLGALTMGNRPEGRLFTAHDLAMAGDFATQAALVLMVAAAQAAAREAEMSDERARIARDLHDHAIQAIFAVGLSLNALAVRVAGPEGDTLVRLVDQLDDAIKSIRRSIFALQRPEGADEPGLRRRVMVVAEDESRALGFRPRVDVDAVVDSTVTQEVAEDVLAVVREALSNAARHARASQVDVRVALVREDTGAELVVVVRDDGQGLGAPSRVSGLDNLRARATRHGGRCDITSGPSGGTTVRWVVPLRPSATPSP